jgi:hypothetical protein
MSGFCRSYGALFVAEIAHYRSLLRYQVLFEILGLLEKSLPSKEYNIITTFLGVLHALA